METRTPGSASGPKKRSGGDTGTALRADSTTPGAQLRFTDAEREIILAATDLIVRSKPIGFTGQSALARSAIAASRCRVVSAAVQITHGARHVRLRCDATWRRGKVITIGRQLVRTAVT